MYAKDTSYSSAVVSGAIEGIMQLPALPSLLTPGSFAKATSSPLPQVGHALAPARMTAKASNDPPSDHEPASGRPNNGSNKRKPAAKLNKTSKGEKKAKTTETTPSKRFVWSNAMIAALLEMRFGDKEVKKRVERADTNRTKALAWQYFASRLSEHLNVVVTSDQVLMYFISRLNVLIANILYILRSPTSTKLSSVSTDKGRTPALKLETTGAKMTRSFGAS